MMEFIEAAFDFSEALKYLKRGFKVARKGWNGKGQYIQLATNLSYKCMNGEIINAEHNSIGNSAIAFVGTSGVQVGWLASQADLLAEDWIFADEQTGEALFDFSEAFRYMQQGFKVRRKMWFESQYVYMLNKGIVTKIEGLVLKWNPSYDDVVKKDWMLVDKTGIKEK